MKEIVPVLHAWPKWEQIKLRINPPCNAAVSQKGVSLTATAIPNSS